MTQNASPLPGGGLEQTIRAIALSLHTDNKMCIFWGATVPVFIGIYIRSPQNRDAKIYVG